MLLAPPSKTTHAQSEFLRDEFHPTKIFSIKSVWYNSLFSRFLSAVLKIWNFYILENYLCAYFHVISVVKFLTFSSSSSSSKFSTQLLTSQQNMHVFFDLSLLPIPSIIDDLSRAAMRRNFARVKRFSKGVIVYLCSMRYKCSQSKQIKVLRKEITYKRGFHLIRPTTWYYMYRYVCMLSVLYVNKDELARQRNLH